jgi:hypothetical protein
MPTQQELRNKSVFNWRGLQTHPEYGTSGFNPADPVSFLKGLQKSFTSRFRRDLGADTYLPPVIDTHGLSNHALVLSGVYALHQETKSKN